MTEGKPLIAVVGPDRGDLPEDLLASARDVGRALSEAGYGVITRHGGGVSANVVRGLEAGTRAVSVVSSPGEQDTIKSPGVEVLNTHGPLAAMEAILERADAAIILRADLETLALLFQIWSYGLSPNTPYRQVILLGSAWRATVQALADAASLNARARAMVTFADDPAEAVESLRYYVAP